MRRRLAESSSAKVSTRTIVLIESGKSVPRFGTIRRISEALGVSPSDVDEFKQAGPPWSPGVRDGATGLDPLARRHKGAFSFVKPAGRPYAAPSLLQELWLPALLAGLLALGLWWRG